MNGNQNLNVNNMNNGEVTPSSLSSVNNGNQSNEQLARINQQKNVTPSGKRAEDYAKTSGLGNRKGEALGTVNNKATANGSLNGKQTINNENARRNMANLKMAAAQELIKKYAAAHGVPEGVTQKAMDTDIGQKTLDNFANKKGLGRRAIDGLFNRGDVENRDNKDESEKSVDQKSDEREAKKRQAGEISFELSLKTIKWLVIITPIITCIFIFVIAVAGAISDEKTSSMVLAGMTAQSHYQQEYGNYGVGSGDEFPDEYYKRLESLGNLYSSQKKCQGDDCLERDEFLYYLKIADLNLRYQHKYNVELDWYLISAANLYFAKTTEETMRANLSNYNKDTVEDYETLSELDWDNDFKNMSGYIYLDADDSRYDLNILAKNMVKKTTIQTCTDGSGNVVKSQEDEDVEDYYFQEGGEKRLNCGAGQSYNISSTYVKDLDKYDEFLLEYIDKKMYTLGSGSQGYSSSSSGTNLSEAFVNLALDQRQDPSAHGGRKYWTYMGFGGRVAWCACFVSWVIENTTFENQRLKDIVKVQSAAVYEFMNWFYNSKDPNIHFYWNDNCSKYSGKNGGGKYVPKQGDLIFFNWNYNWNGSMPIAFGLANHIGIVQRTEGGTIYTIEGNTSDSVHDRQYPLTSCQVIGFGSWY